MARRAIRRVELSSQRGRIEVETSRGVFMISVAAALANMHPQTLRVYEARGLIEPQRSPKGTRLYSQEDVERLKRIQEMTAELGLNLAGVERVLDLEQQIEKGRRKIHAREGVMNIFFEIGQDRPLQFRHRHGNNVQPLEEERQTLTHVADHELQFRKTVENAAANDSNHMNRGFDVPPPGAAGEHVGYHRCKAAV